MGIRAFFAGCGRREELDVYLKDILVKYDWDTVILAFEHNDCAEFFSGLDMCFEHGVDAKVHRDHADEVLTAGDDMGTLVDVDMEPWDVPNYVLNPDLTLRSP